MKSSAEELDALHREMGTVQLLKWIDQLVGTLRTKHRRAGLDEQAAALSQVRYHLGHAIAAAQECPRHVDGPEWEEDGADELPEQ